MCKCFPPVGLSFSIGTMREEGFLIAFQLYDSTIFNSLKAENQTKCYGWAEVFGMWPNLNMKRQKGRNLMRVNK